MLNKIALVKIVGYENYMIIDSILNQYKDDIEVTQNIESIITIFTNVKSLYEKFDDLPQISRTQRIFGK
jgi:hypothetical protein